MDWLQENGTTLLVMVGLVAFFLRGPVLAKATGVETMSVHELAKQLASPSPPLLLDVRSQAEFDSGRIPQAILVPLSELRQQVETVRRRSASRPVAVICRSGNRSLHGAVLLKRAGFGPVFNVSGGLLSWRNQGYPIRT